MERGSEQGLSGLYDPPGRGRKPLLKLAEQERQLVRQHWPALNNDKGAVKQDQQPFHAQAHLARNEPELEAHA